MAKTGNRVTPNAVNDRLIAEGFIPQVSVVDFGGQLFVSFNYCGDAGIFELATTISEIANSFDNVTYVTQSNGVWINISE
jgi:hypothetical protein